MLRHIQSTGATVYLLKSSSNTTTGGVEREGEKERGREREGEREGERERGGEREGERGGERERERGGERGRERGGETERERDESERENGVRVRERMG